MLSLNIDKTTLTLALFGIFSLSGNTLSIVQKIKTYTHRKQLVSTLMEDVKAKVMGRYEFEHTDKNLIINFGIVLDYQDCKIRIKDQDVLVFYLILLLKKSTFE